MKLLFDSDKDELVVNDLHIPLNLLRCMAQPEESNVTSVTYGVTKKGSVDVLTEFKVEMSSLKVAPVATCQNCGLPLHAGIGCWKAKRRARKDGISLL